ncbi:sigma-54 dependent transcriptional regulator [Ectopseudomonas composti]|uniref:sigma-54 dependent transcriptional regulator n=1 Tax=Ectopseudomonas composti TaxID=658457 RepID=UPI000773D7A5|nr:sigma-54 dependent transcriptional regulator [Pseudomonas composti]
MLGSLDHPRRLLIVEPVSDCEQLIPELRRNKWLVDQADLSSKVEPVYDVCVICLQTHHLDYLERIKQQIRDSQTEWIAVMSDDLRRNTDLANFIYEWFFDFHTLPFDSYRLHCTLGRASGMARLYRRITTPPPVTAGELLIGQSQSTRELRHLIDKIAPSDASVLITGESGTGKELVARRLHNQSRRASGPFVAINCGAISEQLIHSELFGHEKGAFTGASQRKIGRIESAQGGTLFLDEIGDLPLEMQANLLRFLQEMTYERVGSSKSMAADVRVLAATHVDLEAAISAGRFREDLYYRLNVLQIQTTPLRLRKEDIALFVEYFSRQYAGEIGRRPRKFSGGAMTALMSHSWPGNVRELANRVRRAQVLAEGRQIETADIGLVATPSAPCRPLDDYLLSAERQALEDALMHYSTNMSNAARSLGVSRPTFYRLLHKHQLR